MGGRQSRAIEGRIRGELEQKLSSIRNDVLSTQASLRASKNEVESLKQQLSTSQNTLRAMDIQLHTAMEFGKQLASTNSEVVSTVARLKALENEVSKLKEQMLSREKLQRDMRTKFYRMIELENQVHSSMLEALSSRVSLEISNVDVNALGEKVMSYDKFHQDMKMKLDKVIELETRLSSINVEVEDVTLTLKASKDYEDGLGKQLLALDNFERDTNIKLHNILELEKQLHWRSSQAISTKDRFEDMKKEENVLKEQLLSCENFHKDMEMKLLKVMQLEKDICATTSEALFAKLSIESLENEERVLNEQKLFDEEKFEELVRINMKKMVELEN